MTRVLALEWAGTGVTVNAICPGVFGTEMNRPLMNDPVKYKEFVAQIPMGRWGEVHEIAGAAVYLASDASSYMTGSRCSSTAAGPRDSTVGSLRSGVGSRSRQSTKVDSRQSAASRAIEAPRAANTSRMLDI